MLGIAIAMTLLAIIHLAILTSLEPDIIRTQSATNSIDISGTIRAIRLVPGLFALIFFNTFNNLLRGVFMSLMDAYGLSLVSVQVWGVLWGGLSLCKAQVAFSILTSLTVLSIGITSSAVAETLTVNRGSNVAAHLR